MHRILALLETFEKRRHLVECEALTRTHDGVASE